jgi:hypothetical protein
MMSGFFFPLPLLNGVLEGGYEGRNLFCFFVCRPDFFTPVPLVHWLLCLKACNNVAGNVTESGETKGGKRTFLTFAKNGPIG